MRKIALGIFAHPDDAEILCTGTLSLLKKSGWSVHIATLATGDKGTAEYDREEIISIRNKEAIESADIIDASYHCLDFEDVYIFYNKEAIDKATSLIRMIKASIVFTSPPSDYMIDHEMTSLIVQTACFCTGIKNMDIPQPPFGPVPYLYYCDPVEGVDKFGKPVPPSIYVDISSEMATKTTMLKCHKSQRNWLRSHHKVDEYIEAMERFARKRGSDINVGFAEGFIQHLGHGYPELNILKEVLTEFVFTKPGLEYY